MRFSEIASVNTHFAMIVKSRSRTKIYKDRENEQEVHIVTTTKAHTTKTLKSSKKTLLKDIIIVLRGRMVRWMKIVTTKYTISSLRWIKRISKVLFCFKSRKWDAIILQTAANAILSFAISNVWTITFLLFVLNFMYRVTQYGKKIGESKKIETIKS